VNPYVAWLKSNIPIVVLVVVMIAAAVALPIISSGMNKSLREEVQKRASNDGTLARIETARYEITQPGEAPIKSTGPANPKTIDVLSEYEKRLTGDVAEVRDFILSRNRQNRNVLISELFPDPPADWRDRLQFQFWRALMNDNIADLGAYPKLLNEVRAGTPPTPESLQADLRRADELFRTQKLAKAASDSLNADEQEELRAQLREVRMGKYSERAQRLAMYASLNAIDAPTWNETTNLEVRQVFDWQWQLWIKQDILRALYKANEDYDSLLYGPVKRVRWLTVTPLPTPANTGSTATPSSPFGGTAPAAAPAAQAGTGGAAPDAKLEAPRDYSASYTGRVSNALYDVRRVRLQIVVDTARIPEVLDALARQNLMTVLDLKMHPTDAYADLEDGYVYGANTTSDLDLTIETIWLREWTSQLMPPQVKEVLTPPVA